MSILYPPNPTKHIVLRFFITCITVLFTVVNIFRKQQKIHFTNGRTSITQTSKILFTNGKKQFHKRQNIHTSQTV